MHNCVRVLSEQRDTALLEGDAVATGKEAVKQTHNSAKVHPSPALKLPAPLRAALVFVSKAKVFSIWHEGRRLQCSHPPDHTTSNGYTQDGPRDGPLALYSPPPFRICNEVDMIKYPFGSSYLFGTRSKDTKPSYIEPSCQ